MKSGRSIQLEYFFHFQKQKLFLHVISEHSFILEEQNTNSPHLLDKSTFESLFHSEFKRLCFFALQYTKDYDTAREITQEAFGEVRDQEIDAEEHRATGTA